MKEHRVHKLHIFLLVWAPICEANSTRKTVLRMSVDGLGKDTNQLLQVLHPVAGSDGFGLAIRGKFLEPVFAADLHCFINMHDQAFMVLCFVQLIQRSGYKKPRLPPSIHLTSL